jgi:hypothetical protein
MRQEKFGELIGRAAAACLAMTSVTACSPLPPSVDDPESDMAELQGTSAMVPAREWRLEGPAVRATITGGPWTLGQGPATQTDPAAGYPAPNLGTQNFAPYFWPFIVGTDQKMLGYFDYRPRNLEEAVVAARSDDGGRSWSFLDKALTFNPNPAPNPLAGNENGQGHPFVIQLRGQTLLYTLDRTPGVKDEGGLIVHRLSPTGRRPLRGAPADETPPALATLRTTGLLNPDGIIGQAPQGGPATILYLQRKLGSNGPLSDVTTPRLARSEDGLAWTDLGPVTGLQDDGTTFIGARGQLLRAGREYLLFYSGGIPADNASDAYHYIGYARSSDLVHWTVVRGLGNPLLSIEPTAASGEPQSWWQGRVFGPAVTVSPNGRRATLLFAGYHTANPNNDFSDYRQIGVLSLVPTGVRLTDGPGEDQRDN